MGETAAAAAAASPAGAASSPGAPTVDAVTAVAPPAAAPPPARPGESTVLSLELNLTRLISIGAIADARAAIIMSTNIAMLGSMASEVASTAKAGGAGPMLATLAIMTGVVSLCSVAAVATAAFPRFSMRQGESLSFFGSIARMTPAEYRHAVSTIDSARYLEDLTGQCHRLASIVNIKFHWVRRALVLMLIAAGPWAGCLYLASRITG